MRASGKKKIIIIVLLAVLMLVSVCLFFLLKNKNNKGQPVPPEWSLSWLEKVDTDFVVEKEKAELLEERLLKLCQTDYGLVQWYQLPIRSQDLKAQQSKRLLAQDQLLYGQYLVEQDRMDDFAKWQQQFNQYFITDDGIRAYLELSIDNTLADPSDEFYAEDCLLYLGLLMQAYVHRPSDSLWQEIADHSNRLLQVFASDELSPDLQLAVPTTAPAPDPAATPTPKPTLTPTPEPLPLHGFFSLSSFNLLTMHQLSVLDSGWQEQYDYWSKLVVKGLISEHLPLYAIAIDSAGEDYLKFTGDTDAVDSENALKTMLHLAEVDLLPAVSLEWLNEQVLNKFIIYENYSVGQGHNLSDQESLAAYAYTARIARIMGNKTLYKKSVELLQWHTATSQRSDALDAIFSQEDDEIIRVNTKENLLALLAYR